MKSSRRQLLQHAGLAATAAALPFAAAIDAHAQTAAQSTKVFHVFAFQWKANATPADKTKAKQQILAFQGVIPGLLHVNVGDNFSTKGKGYSFVGVMQFASKPQYDVYPTHPAHLALLKWLVPLIDPIELDFNA